MHIFLVNPKQKINLKDHYLGDSIFSDLGAPEISLYTILSLLLGKTIQEIRLDSPEIMSIFIHSEHAENLIRFFKFSGIKYTQLI